MRSSLSRKLIATTAIVVMGLTPSLVNPAYADTTPQSATSAVADPTPVPAPKEIEVSARSVDEARAAVTNALVTNDAAEVARAVDADLSPKLERAVAGGGGDVETKVTGIGVIVIIKCTVIIIPPFVIIRCRIIIIIIIVAVVPQPQVPAEAMSARLDRARVAL
jgi:hypothetical protein